MHDKKTLAIGPETDWPTWTWVGFDLVRELAKYYNVTVFCNNIKFLRTWKHPPCDAAIVIKFPLPSHVLDALHLNNIVYFPCDYYKSKQQIERDQFLKKCACLVSHSRYLADILRKTMPNVFEVNHSGRYTLPTMNEYRKDGFVVWIGFSHHIPHLRRWLSEHPIERELVILTDIPGRKYVPGKVTQMQWTPKRQFEMMFQAKAAIDIKGDGFNQLIRAPEKLQTYIASGIPSACNPGPIWDFFKDCGLELCTPDHVERWFSKEYYDETREFGKKVRTEMSLENVGYEVKKIVDGILVQ